MEASVGVAGGVAVGGPFLGGLGLVLLKPFLGSFMWPLAVAGAGGRYFLMARTDKCGASLRYPLLAALRRDAGRGLPML